jgi:hypothetical protein
MNELNVSLQHSILTLAAHGWSHRRIARELDINRETVGSIALALLDAVRCRFGLSLGFENREGNLAKTKQVIEDQLLVGIIHRGTRNIYPARTKAEVPVPRPSGGLERRFNQLPTCLTLVHPQYW